MLLPKSTRSVTDFDELAVRRDAAALRARFLRSHAAGAWKAVQRLLSRLVPDRAAGARDAPRDGPRPVSGPRRPWFSEASAGSWTTTP